jgi:hypothetical protein
VVRGTSMPSSSSFGLEYHSPTSSPVCGTPYRFPSPKVAPSSVYEDSARTSSEKRSSQSYASA